MKSLINPALIHWWEEAREKYNPEEIARFFEENKDKFEEFLKQVDGNRIMYRTSNRMFSFFSRLADAADHISVSIQHRLTGMLPGLAVFIEKMRGWKNQLNFRELTDFTRTKLYSLRHPPHNEKAVQMVEEIMEFATTHGLDLNRFFPDAYQKFLEARNQLLQHKFFQEFSKSRLEQLLAVPFLFDRCIHPVLPDSAFWHRFFEYAERKKVRDIILVSKENEQVSFKHASAKEIASTETVRILNRISEIKATGRRIFFIGHHEGYLGPYFVRSVVRKLGFHDLTKNCNTVVGPRMFSNVVIRNGAANVGNLFLTVPSRKTTEIRTQGLAGELKKIARKTQCLIRLPEVGQELIEALDYNDFMAVVTGDGKSILERFFADIAPDRVEELKTYLADETVNAAFRDLKKPDYDLFKNIMRECFLLFPEGSRSYTDREDGGVLMKYVNPRYMEAYMRPGDYIAPINLVGGSDLTNGWRLRKATLGISIDEPFEVTADMIENFRTEGLQVMQKIAALPNIKAVRFNQEPEEGDSDADADSDAHDAPERRASAA